jgi:hypothetical protein
MHMFESQYWKTIIPALATILTLIAPLALGSQRATGSDWINVAIMAFGTIGAWVATNMSEGIARYTKEIIGALTAGLVLLSSLLSNGITGQEWAQVALAVIMALLLPLKGNDGYVHGVKPNPPAQALPNS